MWPFSNHKGSSGSSGSEVVHEANPSSWIRGVSVGGWLVLERMITPYLFALTDCDLRGDFRSFPRQIDSPAGASWFKNDTSECKPQLPFPADEYGLTSAFSSKELARAYLERHWSSFVQREDLVAIRDSGVEYLRVPLPHWIFGDVHPDEPWVDGAWPHFVRMANLARDLGLQVWPDVHTAPGSQNGLPSSGHLLEKPTGLGWANSADHVERSLELIRKLVNHILKEELQDVVTGIGILNDPFMDVPLHKAQDFYDRALDIIRNSEMDANTAVYIADLFNVTLWKDHYWTDNQNHHHTYLDSHYFHAYAKQTRALNPREHIAYVCQRNTRDTTACCYGPDKKPSKGIQRIIGAWSAGVDTLPSAKLEEIMDGIANTGQAPEVDRQISPERQEFLKNFVKAQMIAYEAAEVGVSAGWFFFNFKMEGGAFAEWDYLRGIREGWIPITDPKQSSLHRFGTCKAIMLQTRNDASILSPFPDPSTVSGDTWRDVVVNDDVVAFHGSSEGQTVGEKPAPIQSGSTVPQAIPASPSTGHSSKGHGGNMFAFLAFATLGVLGYRKYRTQQNYSYATIGHPPGMEFRV